MKKDIKNNLDLKICGITSSKSIKIAANNNIGSLGFASNNLLGPNTCNDKKIKNLIEECNYYKIDSILLTRHQKKDELIKQIDFIKPKTISCSYHYKNHELKTIKAIFKKLKIGVAINPENFNKKYIKSIKNSVDVIYYDLNVYKKNRIKKHPLVKSLKQITFIKKLSIPIYIGGGIDQGNVEKIIKTINPYGLDVSRSLKNNSNTISINKLKTFLTKISVA